MCLPSHIHCNIAYNNQHVSESSRVSHQMDKEAGWSVSSHVTRKNADWAVRELKEYSCWAFFPCLFYV